MTARPTFRDFRKLSREPLTGQLRLRASRDLGILPRKSLLLSESPAESQEPTEKRRGSSHRGLGDVDQSVCSNVSTLEEVLAQVGVLTPGPDQVLAHLVLAHQIRC